MGRRPRMWKMLLVAAGGGTLFVGTVAVFVWMAWQVPTADEVATYTLWLTICTALLGIATTALVVTAYRQFEDARLNNRARISVEPMGLEPWRDSSDQLLGHVGMQNAGMLPAQN